MHEELQEAKAVIVQAKEALKLEEYKRRQAVSKLHAERKHRLKASEVDEIKQKLLAERKARRALEQWLQSELQVRVVGEGRGGQGPRRGALVWRDMRR